MLLSKCRKPTNKQLSIVVNNFIRQTILNRPRGREAPTVLGEYSFSDYSTGNQTRHTWMSVSDRISSGKMMMMACRVAKRSAAKRPSKSAPLHTASRAKGPCSAAGVKLALADPKQERRQGLSLCMMHAATTKKGARNPSTTHPLCCPTAGLLALDY
jgi:hypothetical protein